MYTQPIIQQVQWQDLKVRSEVDIVLELARQEGWEDCEIFGRGDMITEPRESMGWRLFPADLYEGDIPAEGVVRVQRILAAGVRILGIVIADDTKRPEPAPVPTEPRFSISPVRESVGKALSFAGRGLGGLLTGLGGALASLVGLLVKLIKIAGVIAIVAALAYMVLTYAKIVLLVGSVGLFLFGLASSTGTGSAASGEWEYDPKLVVLVEDGSGGTAWVSVLTWYD